MSSIDRRGGLLSRQERALLQRIVERIVDGDTSRLYQKALAEDFGIASAKQIVVIATHLRAKLAGHYHRRRDCRRCRSNCPAAATKPASAIATPCFAERGRPVLVADARAAIDQRTLPGAGTRSAPGCALEAEPGHPLILALKSYCTRRARVCAPIRARISRSPRASSREREAPGSVPGRAGSRSCVQMALHRTGPRRSTSSPRRLPRAAARRSMTLVTAFLSSQGRATEAAARCAWRSVGRTIAVLPHRPGRRPDVAGRLDDADETIRRPSRCSASDPRLLPTFMGSTSRSPRRQRRRARSIEQVPLKSPRTAITRTARVVQRPVRGSRHGTTALREAQAGWCGRRSLRSAGQLAIAALGAGDETAAVTWLREGAVVERDPNLVGDTSRSSPPSPRRALPHAGRRHDEPSVPSVNRTAPDPPPAPEQPVVPTPAISRLPHHAATAKP